MAFKLYNTLTRSLQEFTPIDPQNVRIYSCGPTVYGEPHLGNMRKYFLDDLLKNTIKHILGYPTTHVVNITDVGHLTGENEGDADHGEDKMEKGARREGLTARDVAKKYETLFHENCQNLLIDPFDVTPRATEHIPEQITMIQELETKGYTYNIPGDGIYFDTSKMADYGELVGKKHIEGIQGGSRVEDAGKRNPTDFALWKYNISGKKRDMERDSPRGVGFPGRHIECSAMSIKYLGAHFDIHTGGIDHIPVHHTNEIAQSECSHADHPRVNYRIHYQFLNINGQKISKSLGNVISVQEVLGKGYSPYDLRYFFLQAHYRSFQDFTREGLDAAKKTRHNLKKKIQTLQQTLNAQALDTQTIGQRLGLIRSIADECETALDENGIHNEYEMNLAQRFNGTDDRGHIIGADLHNHNGKFMHLLIQALYDDLNTSKALAALSEIGSCNHTGLYVLQWFDHYVLKLGLFEQDSLETIEVPENVQALAKQRRQAKQEKNWQLADELRKQIDDAGYIVLDTSAGYTLQSK
ncbi:MAG: cysteine--tRNA ligase [Candidatus Absconditabacterales bacterium]